MKNEIHVLGRDKVALLVEAEASRFSVLFTAEGARSIARTLLEGADAADVAPSGNIILPPNGAYPPPAAHS